MRLIRRFTALLLAAVAAVLAVDTVLSVRSHLALLDEDMRRDELTLAEPLSIAAERVWRLDGEAAARALVARVDPAGGAVAVRLATEPRLAAAVTSRPSPRS